MPTIGKIRVDLEGNTRGFRRSMQGAQRSVTGFTRSLRGMAVPLAGITGAVGFGSLIRATSEEAIRVKQLSDRLDTNIEQFTRLSRVLNRSGVGLNQTGVILQRLQRRAADAAAGNEKLREVFESLGINVDQFIQLDATEAFLQLSEALIRVQNPAERIRTAFKLLDTEGVQVLQADLANLRKEMEQTSTITEEQADAVTMAAESWDRLKESLRSAFLTLGQRLGVFETLSDIAENLAQPMDFSQLLRESFRSLVGQIPFVGEDLFNALDPNRPRERPPRRPSAPEVFASRTGTIGGPREFLGGDLTESNRLLREIRDNTGRPLAAVAQ